ncbi:hypothetical protein BGW80DRAFT_1338716 [Lactifluus volemus]|nr:hypothetical protein BGW80DRAFT_1338716 [Lactifluus volemus]
MSVLSLMPLSGLNMRILPLFLCRKPELRVTISSLQTIVVLRCINVAPWCVVGSIVCLGMKLGLNHDPTTQLSDVVSSASVSGGLPSSTSPNDTNMARLSDRNNCGPTCLYRLLGLAPRRLLGHSASHSSDSACGGATPGPVENEDRRIADGSSASSAVRVDA